MAKCVTSAVLERIVSNWKFSAMLDPTWVGLRQYCLNRGEFDGLLKIDPLGAAERVWVEMWLETDAGLDDS